MSDDAISNDNRWLLPEGVEEVLPPRAAAIESLRRKLLDCYYSWGYELIIPPLIEFLESLLIGTGRDLDLHTFKLTDQLTGRLMGVRADTTPQAARIDAHHLRREEPVRLCYIGTILQTLPDGLGRSRDPMQVGAELYGHAGVESDVEVISLALETLRVAGIQAPHLDIGHVSIFRGLARQADLGPEPENRLFDALQRKAAKEIEEILMEYAVEEPVRGMLAALPELNGGVEVLDLAGERLREASETVADALRHLWSIASALERRLPHIPLHFDLAELRGYAYHAGVVFAAFIPGYGQEVVRGGRYDDIGAFFGRARPATGFSADLKTLVAFAGQAPDHGGSGILAPWTDDVRLIAKVDTLRSGGERVVWEFPGQTSESNAMGCDRRLVRRGDTWRVELI